MSLNVWAFTALTVPLVATPGASTAVVLRNSIAGGIRSGVATAIGTNTASICYGLMTAFGVSAALQQHPAIWVAMRIAGTAYLAWLGARSLHRAATYTQLDPTAQALVPRPPVARSLREGFMTNLLNPSLAALYLLMIPQFIPPDMPFARSALTLSAIHVSLAVTWHLAWAAAGGTLSASLSRTRPRRILEAVSGIALLGLAAKLAV